jgi:hypothetical protein
LTAAKANGDVQGLVLSLLTDLRSVTGDGGIDEEMWPRRVIWRFSFSECNEPLHATESEEELWLALALHGVGRLLKSKAA